MRITIEVSEATAEKIQVLSHAMAADSGGEASFEHAARSCLIFGLMEAERFYRVKAPAGSQS